MKTFSEFVNEGEDLKEIEKLLKKVSKIKYTDQVGDMVADAAVSNSIKDTLSEVVFGSIDGNVASALKALQKNITWQEKKQRIKAEDYIEDVTSFLNRLVKKFG